MERIPASTVIESLTTTSEKIRALANAGYLRTEVSTILNIRYQHVRKVLLDAGIKKGLRNIVEIARPPVLIDTALTQITPTHERTLLQAGFEHLGEWKATGAGEFKLSTIAPKQPGVYAFIVDDFVVYVGITQMGFRTRMDHYRRGHKRQRTSSRIKKLISETLLKNKQVKVLIAIPKDSKWHGLPINTAAGLEVALIKTICPVWNLLGTSRTNAHKN